MSIINQEVSLPRPRDWQGVSEQLEEVLAMTQKVRGRDKDEEKILEAVQVYLQQMILRERDKELRCR